LTTAIKKGSKVMRKFRTNEFQVDWTNKTISASQNFLRQAIIPGTDEFKQMSSFINAFPDFKVLS
jgi:hypothetical protein